MSLTRLRLFSSAVALAAATLIIAGCTATPASAAPTSSDAPDAAPTTPTDDGGAEVEAAWLDGGRMIGIVTWGSSSTDCQPSQADVAADGQTLEITLSDTASDNTACTADYAPRAIAVGVPEGVDVTKDVELKITYRQTSANADLDGLASAPQGASEQKASAGWFDDEGIVLLTWGSSTCLPVVEDVAPSDAGATVTFTTTDGACTRDLVPRATVIGVTEPRDDDTPFTLTLKGDNLDGEVAVIG